MLCKCHWIVLLVYIVHVTAFCLGGPFFSGHGVYADIHCGIVDEGTIFIVFGGCFFGNFDMSTLLYIITRRYVVRWRLVIIDCKMNDPE